MSRLVCVVAAAAGVPGGVAYTLTLAFILPLVQVVTASI
jgi:hypothetical protein